MKIQKKNKEFVWVKCGQIDGHEPETEFIDFHEDLYKFTRKSVYCRKYYVMKVIFGVPKKFQ